MSMSMHCFAVKPSDKDYKLKAEAYRACEAARIAIPDDLAKFFNYERPDLTGVTQEIGNEWDVDKHSSCVRFKGDSQSGFEVDITKLPDGTRFVRFVCSY
jgi:hypothetical protein